LRRRCWREGGGRGWRGRGCIRRPAAGGVGDDQLRRVEGRGVVAGDACRCALLGELCYWV
jgi:hypothetical protein